MTMPATAAELQKILEERNLYPWYASANGREPHDGYGLERKGRQWVVYRCGPMSAPREAYFDHERDAVANLVTRLRMNGFAAYVADLEES